jgi:Flp pilus assembly protein TadG
MTLVESALVICVCLLVIVGILEYARYLLTLQVVENAAREGARYAVVNTASATTSQVQDYVDSCLVGLSPTQLQGYSKTTSITVFRADPSTGAALGGSWSDASFGQAIAVKITGNYQPILPAFLFLGATIPIQAQAQMYSEAN